MYKILKTASLTLLLIIFTLNLNVLAFHKGGKSEDIENIEGLKKRDIQIADAVLELFRRADYIENFNKKHLYLLIREMTDCKTHYITKVVNVMKQHQKKMLNDCYNFVFVAAVSFENNTSSPDVQILFQF